MSKLSKFLIIWLWFLCSQTKQKSIRPRQTENCQDSVKIRECAVVGEEFDVILNFTRPSTNSLSADYTSNCTNGSLNYVWKIFNESSTTPIAELEELGNKFVVKPFSFEEGIYSINVEVTIKRNGKTSDIKGSCAFEMQVIDPLPVIDGGNARTIEPDQILVLDGTKSVDNDVAPNQKSSLIYKWTCEVVAGDIKNFCQKEYQSSTLEVPKQFVTKNYKYKFILSVKNLKYNNWMSTSQVISIVPNVSELVIICLKNCPPAALNTNPYQMTVLKVKCMKNCPTQIDFEWTTDMENFDYKTMTQSGRFGEQFIIKEKVLQSAKQYQISVTVKNGTGSATEEITISEDSIKIKSCITKPTEGTAIETKFKIDCEYHGTVHKAQIVTKDDVILSKSTTIQGLEFVLPGTTQLFVKLTDINDFQDMVQIDVKVVPTATKITPDSIRTELEKGNLEKAIQLTDASIKQTEPKELLNIFDKVPMSTETNEQVSAIVSKLAFDPGAPSDPFRGEIATRICHNSTEINLATLSKENYPTTFANDVIEKAKITMRCGETQTTANFEILIPKPVDFHVTTEFPMVSEPVIEEHYPDYDIDGTVVTKTEKYAQATENYIKICENNLKMLSLTTIEDENVAAVAGNSSAQISKGPGFKLLRSGISTHGALVQLSPDLDFGSIVDVMICSWSNDLFWWNLNGTKIATNVILIKIESNGTKLTSFQKGNLINFDMKEQKFEIHSVAIKNLTTIRIDVKKNENFLIEFFDLIDDSVMVLITNFEKPSKRRVKKEGKIVSQDVNLLQQEENNGFDSWYYLSILTSPKTISFSVYTKACYFWNNTSSTWQPACKVRLNPEKITCTCHHFSILAGIVYNNTIKDETILLEPDFTMVLSSTIYIFVVLAITLFIYSILLLFLIRTSTMNEFYVPGDISTSARHVYLVVVKTGRRPFSGTSSKICLQLVGDHSRSQNHILNFPDPQGIIFQRSGTDFFVVPTVRRLGNLEQVVLWSDFSGRTPLWYCTSVTIYDFQNEKVWYFEVKRWFDLPPKGTVECVVVPGEKRQKRCDFWCQILPQRTHQSGFSHLRKFHFLLAIFLNNFLFCLVFHGVPQLVLNDGFDYEEFQFDVKMIWIGIISAGITFTIQTILMCFSKKSQKGMQTLCWGFLIFDILSTITVLVVFGFWVPQRTSWYWLISVAISILSYHFLLENLYEISFTFLHKEQSIDFSKWNQNLKIVDLQREYLFHKFGEYLLRPYFTSLYKPLDADDIKERKLKFELKAKFWALLEDTIMFFLYLVVLYLAIFADRNPHMYQNYKEMVNLMSGYHSRTESFKTITSFEELYDYINTTLIPTLHSEQWYSKYVQRDPCLMADFTNKLLGVARIRQKRIISYPCNNNLDNGTCRNEFWVSQEDFTNFGNQTVVVPRLENIWYYTNSKMAGMTLYVGKFGVYYGGGFIVPLGRTWYNSHVNLYYILNSTWFDFGTSTILIEFLAYNANTNLFTSVRLVFENSASGYFRKMLEMNTSQLLFIKDEQLVRVIVFGCFFCTICMFTIKFLVQLWKLRFRFWKDLWILLDLVLIGFSFSTFVFYLFRTKAVRSFLEGLEGVKKNEFLKYFNLFQHDLTFVLVAAFLIFISTLRLWKACRFGTIFRIMELTIQLSVVPILVIFTFHIILLMGYTGMGFMIFANDSTLFGDILESFITLMLLIVGMVDFDFDILISINPILTEAYYSSYMILNHVFTTIYGAVIIMHYYQAGAQSNPADFLSVKTFVRNEYGFYRTLLKVKLIRLKGGTVPKNPMVVPKSDDLRFANCLTLESNRLQLMRVIIIFKMKDVQSVEVKLEQMRKIAKFALDSDDVDVFYREKIDTRFKIIHDLKIVRVARAVEAILGDQRREEQLQKRSRKVLAKQTKRLDYMLQALKQITDIVTNIDVQ